MITAITGTIARVLDEDVRLRVGAFEYSVQIPEFVRRQVQTRMGEEVTLHTVHFLEGNQMSPRMTPRLVGFLAEADLDFFELLCTVDKFGVRKALKALARPVRDIAEAIEREDVKWLSTLPGVGKSTAEGIINALRKKVSLYAAGTATRPQAAARSASEDRLADDAYAAMINLGHNPADARSRLEAALANGTKYPSVEALLTAIYAAKK